MYYFCSNPSTSMTVIRSQLAVYKSSSGIQAIMSSKARERAKQDEEAVMESGIAYTIIRAGMLQNSPGGVQGFSFGEVSILTSSKIFLPNQNQHV